VSPTESKRRGRHDYQILFKDSSDGFWVENARMVFSVNGWVMFLVFDGDEWTHNEYYPTENIQRIKRIPRSETKKPAIVKKIAS